jgi:hypothetical protein
MRANLGVVKSGLQHKRGKDRGVVNRQRFPRRSAHSALSWHHSGVLIAS